MALVNADELVVRGVAAMFQGHLDHCQLVELSSTSADVVLFDTAPSGHPLRQVAQLLADPRIGKVVVHTWNFQPWLAGDFIRHGASGYLSKALPAGELVTALRAVHAGRVVVAPDRRGVHDGTAWVGQDEGLTAREAEVLSLIAGGLSNSEVAARMGLSINSVKSYVRSSYRKIGADSRSRAVLWALTHGLGPGSETPTRIEAEAVAGTEPGQDRLA